MQITSKEWLDYVTKLASINKKASTLLNDFIQVHGTEDMYPIIEYAYSLVNRYGGASSELACQMYDQLAKLQNANVIGAVPADLPEMADVARAINGTKDKLNGPADAIGRLVKKSASDTMIQNAKRDGAEYAWINHGDSCVYCKYLSSFGWLHANLNNGNRYLGHIHNHCDCEFAIRFDGESTVEGYDPVRISKEIDDAEGATINEKLNSMRRKQYEHDGEKIRAQKRKVFQTYRPLDKGEKKNFVMNRSKGLTNISANKLNSYHNPVYLSVNAKVSRRDVHTIYKNTLEAYKKYDFKNLELPKIVIIDQEELKGAFGLYDCVTNTVYYSSDIVNRQGMEQFGGVGITEFHEMWHAKQADNFKGKGWIFTDDNRNEYIQQLRKDCKPKVDNLGITGNNVREISNYASSSYASGNWDEVEAEYQAYYYRKG